MQTDLTLSSDMSNDALSLIFNIFGTDLVSANEASIISADLIVRLGFRPGHYLFPARLGLLVAQRDGHFRLLIKNHPV